MLGALGLGFFIPQNILGLLPIVMGIKTFIKGDNDEKEEAEEAMSKHTSLRLQILTITVGLGIDDLAVYVPFFTTLSSAEFIVMAIIFVIATGILCYLSYKLTSIKPLTELIEKYERPIVGMIFVAVALFIMYESGTFEFLGI